MYKKRTLQEKQEELKRIQAMIETQVDHYLVNPDVMAEFIQFGQQFHQYSLRNRLLIKKQLPNASFIASFKEWNEKGYQVNKGAKALKIMRPVFRYEFLDENGDWIEQKYASIQQKRQMVQAQLETRKRLIGTATASVFDISQTNVPAADYPLYVKRHFISESERSFEDYIRGCHLYAQKHQVSIGLERLGGFTGGYYQYESKRIALNDHLENEKLFGTLVHEIAHSRLHPVPEVKLSHEAMEIQAQGVSAIVLQYYGQEPYEYSLDYLKTFSEKLTQEDRTQLLSDTLETCFDITQTIDEYIEHKVHYQTLRQTYGLSEEHYNDYFIKQLYDLGEDEPQQQAFVRDYTQNQTVEERTASLTYALNHSNNYFETSNQEKLEVQYNATNSQYTLISDTNQVRPFKTQQDLVDYLVKASAIVSPHPPIVEVTRSQQTHQQRYERSL